MFLTFCERIEFLDALDLELKQHLHQAAQLHAEDPASSCVSLRKFAEHLVTHHLLEQAPRGLFNCLELLKAQQLIPSHIIDDLDLIRQVGNRGAHSNEILTSQACMTPIRKAYEIAVWFAQDCKHVEDVLPVYTDPTPAEGYKIFRDAMIGGPDGEGESEAKYLVALALEADERRRLKQAKQNNDNTVVAWRERKIELLREAMHSVPAARSKLATLILNPPQKFDYFHGSSTVLPSEDDLKWALELLEWAAEADDPEGLFLLGVWYLGEWTNAPQDLDSARVYWERAAEQEHPGALNGLYVLGVQSENEEERARAIELMKRSARMGMVLGQYHYGMHLLEESQEDPDRRAEAVMWLRRAASQQFAEAQFQLAMLIVEQGIDVPSEDAKSLIASAMKSKHVQAMLWWARQECSMPDEDVQFFRVGDVLNQALEEIRSSEPEVEGEVRAELKTWYERYTRFLKSLPLDERVQDLNFEWFHFKKDGTRKFASRQEAFEYFMGFKNGDQSFENWMDSFEKGMVSTFGRRMRAQLGPHATEAQIQRIMIECLRETEAQSPSQLEARGTIVKEKEPGRNDPCL